MNDILSVLNGGQPPSKGPAGTSPNSPEEKPDMVATPMGALYPIIQHPTFKSFERMFRRKGSPQMFNADITRNRPFSFNIGSFQVSQTEVVLITSYNITASRFSGIAAGDTTPVEYERMGTHWGFDLTIDRARSRDCKYEVDPLPIQQTPQAYITGQAFGSNSLTSVGRTPSVQYFEQQNANTFANTTGAGLSTLPFRLDRYGAPEGPFTIPLYPGQIASIDCNIFKPLPIPIAYVECSLKGWILPATLANKFMQQLNP